MALHVDVKVFNNYLDPPAFEKSWIRLCYTVISLLSPPRIFMIMQIQPQSLLLFIWLVFEVSSCVKLDFHTDIRRVDWFQEGAILELYCTQDGTNDIIIELMDQVIIVKGSHLVEGVSDRYAFQKNSAVSVLFIKALSRNDNGTYVCSKAGQNTKFALVKVLYSPSDKSPQCLSDYDSFVIFDDLRPDYINFTCITDEGNPPVSVKADIFLSKTTGSTNVKDICSENVKVGRSTSFSCHMNESLNNATFHCNVTQQFPYPHSGGYRGSCSFGPLDFLPSFSVTTNGANVSVKQGQNFNLTCTTNVSEVLIKWSGIPEDWGYTVKRDDYFSFVWIENVKQQSMQEITVQCVGYYGNRNVTDSVKVNVTNLQSGKPVLGIAILVTLIGSCIYYSSKRLRHCSLRRMSTSDRQQTQSTELNAITVHQNKSNANNTAIEGNEKKNNSDTSGDQLEDMCINPVYESASIAANIAEFQQDDKMTQ